MKHAISLSNIFYRVSILKLASRISDLKNKYPEYADKIDMLARRDPSGNHKYLPYAVKTLVSGKALENEIADVVDLFHKYQHKLDNKDINSYKNFTELRDTLFEIDRDKNKSKRQEKLEIKTEGGRKIYEDNQCVVIYVKDKAASCFYGSGTKWCITMENHDYFEDYQSENIIFYFILRKDLDKENSNYKVAVVVYRDDKNKIKKIEYFDAMDAQSETPRYTKDLTNWEKILTLITQDAENIPKPVGAKIKNNEATEEELLAEIEKGNYLNHIALFTSNPKIMKKIFNHPKIDRIILVSLARNENLPPEMFEKILNHPKTDYSVLLNLAKNPNLPPEMFEKILNHPKTNDYVLFSLAKKPNLPPEMFEKILNHPKTDYITLEILANNKNLSSEMFERILNHPKVNWFALDAMAVHKNLPPELFEKILNHPAANDRTKKIIKERIQELNKEKTASIKLRGLLNKFYKISILKLASRISDLKNKYPEYADKIDMLARRDPSGNHKYLSYAVKVLVSGKALENEIADVVELFHKYQHKLDNKDINSYKNFTELMDILFDIDAEKGKSKRREKLEIKTEGGRKIYEDDQCVVIYVKDKAASCFYGSGTKWCITMENHYYFEDYQSENFIFYFVLRKDLDKENSNYKVALIVHRDEKNKIKKIEYFDAMDTRSEAPRYTKDLTNWEKILTLITQDAESISKTIGAKIKNNEATEEEKLEEIEKGNYLNTIATFTNNPKIMKKIFNHPKTDSAVLERLVYNENLPPEMFEKILNHPKTDSAVLERLACNENLPPEMFEKILNHPKVNSNVLENLAVNEKLPSEMFEKILNHPKINNVALYYISKDPYLPPELFEKIFNHPEVDNNVLESLVVNEKLPPEMFEKILNHPKINNIALYYISKDPNLPPELFEKILNYPSTDSNILYGLTINRNLPPEMFEKILNHPEANSSTLYTLTQNTNLPPELFEKILNHPAADDRTKKIIKERIQELNKEKIASIKLRTLNRKLKLFSL